MKMLISYRKKLLYSGLAGLAMAIAVVTAWYILNQQEDNHVERVTASTAFGVEALLSKDIEGRIVSLSGLANHWQGSGEAYRAQWEVESRNIYDAQPGYRTIGWIDPSMHVRWLTPVSGNEITQDFDLRLNRPAFLAAEQAKESGRLIFSTPLESVLRGKGMGLYVPVYDPRSKQFDGLIGGLLLFDPLLQTAVPQGLLAQHDIVISVNDESVYSSTSAEQPVRARHQQQRRFNIGNLEWTVALTPKQEFLQLVHSRFLTIMLVAGLILSGLMALTVYLGILAVNRVHQVGEVADRMAILFKNLPGMAYRCLNQPKWQMEFVSEGCQQLSGYSRSDFEDGRVSWRDLIVPEDRDLVWERVQQAVLSDRAFELEYRILTSDGEERWIWERGRPTDMMNDDIVYLEGYMADITGLKSAETESIKEKGLSDAIVKSALEGVITVDADGIIEAFNPAAEEMFGYASNEVIGKNIEILIPAERRKVYWKTVEDYLKTGDRQSSNSGNVTYGRRKDGSQFPYEGSINQIEHQTEQKLIFLIRDVSNQRAIEQEARELQQKLAHTERFHTLGEMASGIAHELNQPLTAVSNYMAASRDMIDDTGPDIRVILKEALNEASSEAIRAGNIVRRLREFIAKGEVSRQIYPVAKLVEDAATIGLVGAREKSIDWSIDIDPNSNNVMADSVQIQQVIVNLMRNAIEAMEDSPVKHLTISASPISNGYTEIRVEDSGSGISEEIRGTLFSAFSSTKSNGMGLGLSICRTIVESHGGEITAEPGSNGGTIFRFTLTQVTDEISDE